jgi:hypothetical protein
MKARVKNTNRELKGRERPKHRPKEYRKHPRLRGMGRGAGEGEGVEKQSIMCVHFTVLYSSVAGFL